MTATYETCISGCVLRTAIAAVDGFHLSYILTEEGVRSYSFFTALCGVDGNEGDTDAAYVSGVKLDRETALRLFSLMADGAVTPCTLEAIIEDYIASM